MKKNIYQLACFLQEDYPHGGSIEDFKEDMELMQEDILNLMAETIGRSAVEEKLNAFKAAVHGDGYATGRKMGAQLARLLAGEADTIKITEEDEDETELVPEEIWNLLTERMGNKLRAEEKINTLKAAVFDQGYMDGLRATFQKSKKINDPTTNQKQRGGRDYEQSESNPNPHKGD